MNKLMMGLLLLAGYSINQYLDPEYAQQRFDQALAGVEETKPLACVATSGTFWVRGGDWEEIVIGNEDGVDYIVVLDSDGNKHTIRSDVANPNCTVKE
jgi:hypothetical protein